MTTSSLASALGNTTVIFKDLNRNFGGNGYQDLLYDSEAISQALFNLFQTVPGEAGPIFEPEFGSLLPLLIHEPMDEVTTYKLEAAVFQAVQRWEPRITILLSQSGIETDLVNQSYKVTLTYTINSTGENAVSNVRLKANELISYTAFSRLEKVVALHTLGWPGIKDLCTIDLNGHLKLISTNSWLDLTDWTNFLQWGSSSETFTYTTIVDNFYEVPRVVKLGLAFTSDSTQVEVQLSTSSNGVTFTDFAPLIENPVSSRYLKFKFTVTGPDADLTVGNIFFYV